MSAGSAVGIIVPGEEHFGRLLEPIARFEPSEPDVVILWETPLAVA